MNGYEQFCDHLIELASQSCSKTISGSIEVTLKYGRPNNLKYELKLKKAVWVWFDKDGNFRPENISLNDA